jgi:hypothetical protein
MENTTTSILPLKSEALEMSENFLHQIWKFGWFKSNQLKTSSQQSVRIVHPGLHNHHAGPDFLNARIHIGDTLWWGNVELHIRASDWHRHNHQDDTNYKNVILHVVLHNDAEIFLHTPGDLPVLELTDYLHLELWKTHKQWTRQYSWIPCESVTQSIEPLVLQSTIDRMLIERMQLRVEDILKSLEKNGGNWSQVAFKELCKAFGFKSNSLAMEMLANSIPISVIARHKSDPFQLEALLFGQAGLLQNEKPDEYEMRLRREYDFLRKKHQLETLPTTIWNFGKVRPANSPLLRLAQLSSALAESEHLVSSLLNLDLKSLRTWLRSETNPYWQNHYRFGRTRKTPIQTTIAAASANQIIINVACRLRFAFGHYHHDANMMDAALSMLQVLPAEKNAVTQNWINLGRHCEHASDSQALIQLYSVYCTHEKCIECPIGVALLPKNKPHETNT